MGWLETHLDDPNLRILDCTTFVRASEDGYSMESGLQSWEKAHIPGNVFADLSNDLSVSSQKKILPKAKLSSQDGHVMLDLLCL
jgi:3-mercaptopyruvate sulfurtransferase SseA